MGLFDSFKKQKTVWRDSSGNIRCLGDNCAQKKCDDTCPIWIQTVALGMARIGEHQKAIEEFRRALELAPDFKDIWVNMAACYGSMNDHLEANKAYKAAYMLDKGYKNALFGLIISCKNLGQFDEALKYCEEYASKINKTEAESLKAKVLEAKQSGTTAVQYTEIEMAQKILQKAEEIGLIDDSSSFPNIPEIMVERKRTCSTLFTELNKLPNGGAPAPWLAWSAYAGIGAVEHWDKDWGALQNKGVIETLLEPRGADEMDEYVTDLIGIGFKTEEGKQLQSKLFALSVWALETFVSGLKEEQVTQTIFEVMGSMYLFGMVFQMRRLGMR